MATISSPETTSDTNTHGLATISSPESTEQGNLQNSNPHISVVNLYVLNELLAVYPDRDAARSFFKNGFSLNYGPRHLLISKIMKSAVDHRDQL
jgi:hypothetical protein